MVFTASSPFEQVPHTVSQHTRHGIHLQKTQLDYCISLISGCSKGSLKSLQLILNAAERGLTGTKMRGHISHMNFSLLVSC